MQVNWSITKLLRYTSSDHVCTIRYGLEAVDSNNERLAYVDYLEVDLEGEKTIEYEDLTPDICIGWVKAALGPEGVEEEEERITNAAIRCAGISDTFPTNWPT